MNNSCLKKQSPRLLGTMFILLGTAASSQATTLSGFSTYGSDMTGMRVTASFLDGTSQSLIWGATGSGSGGVFGSGWSLTESGNTYPQIADPSGSRWTLNSALGITSLVIDAIPGNTVFDNVPGLGGPLDTPGSAEGWNFQPVLGLAPTSYAYSDPIDISQGDLFGRLSMYWSSGFAGVMQFIADTDSGTSSNPVQPRDPVAYNAAPNLSVSLSTPTIYESQGAAACFSAYEPDQTAISFFLNGAYLGTVPNTGGTSSLCTNLGVFPDNGVYNYTVVARDDRGYSSQTTSTLTVLNVAPTLASFDLSKYVINEGQSVSALLSATDPGADSETFFINGSSIGTDLRTSGTRLATTTLGPFATGTYTFTAKAQDKDGADSNVITRTLQVLNVAPTITKLTQDLVVKAGEFFNFAVSAFDPGKSSNALTYQWDLNGDGLFDNFTGATGKWSFPEYGNYKVAVRVSDGNGGYAYGSFNVESVPEPSSTLGVLIFSTSGATILWKRKRQDKKNNKGS